MNDHLDRWWKRLEVNPGEQSETRLLIFLMDILAGEVFSLRLEKARVVRRRWGGEERMGWDGMEQVEQALA